MQPASTGAEQRKKSAGEQQTGAEATGMPVFPRRKSIVVTLDEVYPANQTTPAPQDWQPTRMEIACTARGAFSIRMWRVSKQDAGATLPAQPPEYFMFYDPPTVRIKRGGNADYTEMTDPDMWRTPYSPVAALCPIVSMSLLSSEFASADDLHVERSPQASQTPPDSAASKLAPAPEQTQTFTSVKAGLSLTFDSRSRCVRLRRALMGGGEHDVVFAYANAEAQVPAMLSERYDFLETPGEPSQDTRQDFRVVSVDEGEDHAEQRIAFDAHALDVTLYEPELPSGAEAKDPPPSSPQSSPPSPVLTPTPSKVGLIIVAVATAIVTAVVVALRSKAKRAPGA